MSFLESAPKEDMFDLEKNLGMALRVGEINLKVMELLDTGHKVQLGVPEPTEVADFPREGKVLWWIENTACLIVIGQFGIQYSDFISSASWSQATT